MGLGGGMPGIGNLLNNPAMMQMVCVFDWTPFQYWLFHITVDLLTARPPVLVFMIYASLAWILNIIWKPYRSILILLTNNRTRSPRFCTKPSIHTLQTYFNTFTAIYKGMIEYNRRPDKASLSRRHFGRAVDRSLVGKHYASWDSKLTLVSPRGPDSVACYRALLGLEEAMFDWKYFLSPRRVAYSNRLVSLPSVPFLSET